MEAKEFIGLLKSELGTRWAVREWNKLGDSPGPTTTFMRRVFEEIALSTGSLQQVIELWRIDFLWFRSEVPKISYYSGQLERQYPVATPEVAIEHDNYGHENVAAAFLRLLGVRAGLRVLVAWSANIEQSLDRLKELRQSAITGGVLRQGDTVLAVIFDENSDTPVFKATLFGHVSCKEVAHEDP